jgi:hypothetical protein
MDRGNGMSHSQKKRAIARMVTLDEREEKAQRLNETSSNDQNVNTCNESLRIF